MSKFESVTLESISMENCAELQKKKKLIEMHFVAMHCGQSQQKKRSRKDIVVNWQQATNICII